ncbi:MAG: helix-turn-helix domain-containing protein [Candidatus Fibromonas sp.]|jgi:transcriptional regulator with XRE-family HTH domain|nr:helix-turn-helix domain-containing protein [Candidatus Fibromonas sp.]
MIKFPNAHYSQLLIRAFSNLLCEEREKRRISQLELARKSGLTRQSISLFESGLRAPTFFSVFRLAIGFNMPVTRLVALMMNRFEDYERSEKIAAADSKKAKWRA